jgi:hypothetical protein
MNRYSVLYVTVTGAHHTAYVTAGTPDTARQAWSQRMLETEGVLAPIQDAYPVIRWESSVM